MKKIIAIIVVIATLGVVLGTTGATSRLINSIKDNIDSNQPDGITSIDTNVDSGSPKSNVYPLNYGFSLGYFGDGMTPSNDYCTEVYSSAFFEEELSAKYIIFDFSVTSSNVGNYLVLDTLGITFQNTECSMEDGSVSSCLYSYDLNYHSCLSKQSSYQVDVYFCILLDYDSKIAYVFADGVFLKSTICNFTKHFTVIRKMVNFSISEPTFVMSGIYATDESYKGSIDDLVKNPEMGISGCEDLLFIINN